MKKVLLAFLTLFFLCCPIMTAFANSPAPPSYFYCKVENVPNDAVFVDILIEISAQSSGYTDLNSKNLLPNITADSEIVRYNQDGYRSLSFHYDVLSRMEVDSPYFTMNVSNQSMDKVSKSIKVALLDINGNIIKISDAVNTTPPTNDEFARTLNYDASSSTPTIQFMHFYKGSSNILFILPFILILIARLLISVGVETIIAVPFKLNPLRKIIVVNVLTQTVLILFMQFSTLPYVFALIIAEAFVYLSEYIAYVMLFKEEVKWKLAAYTIVANTVTLVIGLVMNNLHLLV